MSFVTLNWALKLPLPPRTSSAKAVLIVLSYRAKRTLSDRFECYPSIAYLVGATGQNRKTILSNLAKLQRWGLLSDTGRRMGKTRQVIVYRLHMRDGISTSHPQKSSKGRERGPKTDTNRPGFNAQQNQTRDTNSSYGEDGDRSFCAHAREKDGGCAATDIPSTRRSSQKNAQVQALIEDLAQLLKTPEAKRRRRSTDSDARDQQEGGTA